LRVTVAAAARTRTLDALPGVAHRARPPNRLRNP
jgi:hypothetical protein